MTSRSRRARAGLGLAAACAVSVVALGCRGRGEIASGQGGATGSRSAAAPAPAVSTARDGSATAGARPDAAAPDAAAVRLLLAGKSGLQEVDLAGRVVRTVTKARLRYPRLAGAASVMAVAADKKIDWNGSAVRLVRIDLGTGAATTVAKIAPFRCVPPAQPEAAEAGAGGGGGEQGGTQITPLALQTEDDFGLTADGKHACLRLMDRNLNMASVILDTRIDLSSGEVQRQIALGGDVCTATDEVPVVERGDLCSPGREHKAAAERRWPFRFLAGSVESTADLAGATAGSRKRTRIQGLDSGEEVSPSGRWELVAGDREAGDSPSRAVALFDRETGQVFPIGGKPGSWPPAYGPDGKPPRAPKTIVVVAEDEVRWLDTGPLADALLVRGLLVLPGKPSLKLTGDVAR
jgi:hypothetical protein